jgi:hypothetical protein
MEPFRLLIVLSTTRWSRRLGEVAIREAKAAREAGRAVLIDVIYVVEQDEIDRLVQSAGDKGFLSDDVEEDLASTLLSEHDRVASRRRGRLIDAVSGLGATVTWNQVTGDYEAEVRTAVQDSPHDLIVLVQSKRSLLERLLLARSEAAEDDRVVEYARDESGTRVVVEEGV